MDFPLTELHKEVQVIQAPLKTSFSESHKGTLVNSNTRPLEAEVDKTDGQFNGSTVWRLGGKQFHRNVTGGRGLAETFNHRCFSCAVAEMDTSDLFALPPRPRPLCQRSTTLKNMLPEVGDLQRSSDVAEPSLMSHRPAAETRRRDREKKKSKTTNKQRKIK